MAQILVPGVAQATMKGFFGNQPWACVTSWKYDNQTGPWTQANVQALADQISSQWNTHMAGFAPAAVTLNQVDTVDIGTSAPAVGQNLTIHPGTSPNVALTSATCTVISFRIPARYRGG